MALEFKLPDIGEGVAEGEIVKWLVPEGQAVEEHQPIVEVMTDKATVEIPAPRAGTVTRHLAAEGDVVPVGTVIFHLEEGAAAPAPSAAPVPAPTPVPSPAAPTAPAETAGSPAGDVLQFKLPDIGEGVAEGEVVQWLVAEGDRVAEYQPVVEVMTDKATVEIPAPAAGRVVKQLVPAGDVVPVGTVIFHLETTGAAAPAPAAAAREPALATVSAGTFAAAPAAANGKVLAVPSARRVARELGVDLQLVSGSGRGGVIRRADVEAFAASGAAVAPAASPAGPPVGLADPRTPGAPTLALVPERDETRVPFRGVRRKIAEAMVRSKYTAPHFTVVEELDVTDLVKVRAEGKALAAEQGLKLTYMPFIMKAVASGLAKYPQLNSKLDEQTQEVVTYHRVHLGIATDTEHGLIVPVLRDVQAKGMLQLAGELGDLAERTRSGKARPEELRGSTFSITNAGNIGGTLATPIINFPDAGILGVHRIVKRPGVVETPEGDRIEVRQFMNLSISVDHRIVDGATAARFLVHMRRLLENPGLLAL